MLHDINVFETSGLDETEGERERERDRERDRQTDRQTETERETERETDRQTERDRESGKETGYMKKKIILTISKSLEIRNYYVYAKMKLVYLCKRENETFFKTSKNSEYAKA